MVGLILSSKRYGFLVVCVTILFLIVGARAVYLHTYGHRKYAAFLERVRQKFEVLPARRGTIVDNKGYVLATTCSSMTVGVDPQLLDPTQYTKLPALAALLEVPLEKLQGQFISKAHSTNLRRWIKLAENVDDSVYEQILSLKIKGVYGYRTYERFYPSGKLAAHVLGYLNKEGQAVCGAERSMHFYLSGQDGWLESEKDGKQQEAAQFRSRTVPAFDGLNVELTLDRFIQNTIEGELERLAAEFQPTSASIIVSDPHTGYILGLANLPTYDPNQFWKFDLETHRNRAISDLYEPGSTFKIIVTSAALNEGLLDLNESFDCSLPTVTYKNKVLKLPKDDHPCGKLTLAGIIEHSSNRGAAHLGLRLGEERLYQYVRRFGFGSPTGYAEAETEASGIVHPVKRWDSLTITRLPMGHALAVTPLQLHFAMATIANGGMLMKPQVIKRIFDAQGDSIVDFKPVLKRRVLKKTVAQTITTFLTKVAGSKSKAKVADLAIAGKTGTSQLLEPQIVNGKSRQVYSHKHYVASFSGFFPAQAPEAVVTIVVQKPILQGTAYGNLVAAPVFKRIAEKLVQYWGIPKSAS